MAYIRESEDTCIYSVGVNCLDYDRCARCGWNPDEDKRRREAISQSGLQSRGKIRYLSLRKISLETIKQWRKNHGLL